MVFSTTMLNDKKIPGCLLAGLFCVSVAFGQYKLEKPVIIGKETILPSNDVRAIRKGKDGFIWIATTEGLCRFDGQQVKVYQQGNDPRISPFDNSILNVIPFNEEVWMGTNQGISVLNTNDDTFRHYQLTDTGKADSIFRQFGQAVTVLYQDRQNNIWAGTKDRGVWLYDKSKDDFRKFTFPDSVYKPIVPAIGTQFTVLSIEGSESNDSIIWVGTTAGLQQINKYNGQVSWFTFPKEDKDYQVSLNAFRRLHHHDNGLLYVGSWGAGVNVFDPVKKTFTPLVVKESAGSKILQGTISNVQRKSKDEIWITTSDGLGVYDIGKEAITWHKFNQPLKLEFYGVDYVDDDNRVWHSSFNGIQYFDPVAQQFSTWSFEDLLKDKTWVFAFYIVSDKSGDVITVCPRIADGLYHFDKITKEWTKSLFNGLAAMGHERIVTRGFQEISPGQYMISADEGLFLYSLSTKKLTVIKDQPHLVFKRWGEILKDSYGNLWISADADGLVKWNVASKKYQIYKDEILPGYQDGSVGRVSNFFEDSRHNIWFSRSDGFSVYVSATGSFINFMYSKNPANSFPVANRFAEDKNGKLWIASGDGFYGYADVSQPEKGVLKKFDLKAQGINGYMPFLATDKEGHVWGYTSSHLLKISADDLSVSAFSFDYGVKAADFYHLSFLPSGEMIFGGRNSITLTKTAELKRNAELPVPYIVQLRLMNQLMDLPYYSGGKGLRLSYRQNFISIFFSARAFTMSNAVRFRYRLRDFDDWTETSSGRLANYTNIPPGDYVFQLQAANNEGVWNNQLYELPLHIATPWWLTWWFRIATVLLIAGLIYWLYRYRISQVKKKEKLKTQYEKKLANVEMTALLAQMNPHFLFNSLNSIDSYIIKNESGKASEYLNNFARLMRLILQNSRSNYITLKDELEALDLYLQMERLRFNDKFQYEIKVSDDLDTGSVVIPPMLIQPYVENAIWHGLMHKKDGTIGKVEILINRQENNLICVVQDNGIGRNKAEELKAQKPGTRKRSMGLQITNDRIEMINKLYDTRTSVRIIDLKDEEGKAQGTCVKLIIPF